MDMELARNKGPSEITTAVGQLGPVGELFTVRLQRAEYLLSRETSKAWTGHRLRTGTIGVLSQIVQVPGISQNELSKRTTYDKSAINAIVNSLEELGWAERRPSVRDRRSNALHATEQGHRKLHEIIESIQGIEKRMLARVPAETLTKLAELLDMVHASCLSADST